MSSPTEHLEAEHNDEVLAVDPRSDSDLGESINTDTTSLKSAIEDYVYENGRRYHAYQAGHYVLPNDEPEQDRLDMLHHTYTMMLNGALHLVKLDKPVHRVLDVGTGTGIWAMDFADCHPEAEVIGVDLSPIQPSWTPPNCKFEVDDIEKPWTWKLPFDFVHSRNMGQGIKDWPRYLKQIYDNLTPGGTVQIHEATALNRSDDDSIPPDGPLALYFTEFARALEAIGYRDVTSTLEQLLLDAGFVDVQCIIKKLPAGTWPKDPRNKEIGKYGLACLSIAFKSYGMAAFTRVLGKGKEEAEKMCEDAYRECAKRSVHSWNPQVMVSGRRPEVVAE